MSLLAVGLPGLGGHGGGWLPSQAGRWVGAERDQTRNYSRMGK